MRKSGTLPLREGCHNLGPAEVDSLGGGSDEWERRQRWIHSRPSPPQPRRGDPRLPVGVPTADGCARGPRGPRSLPLPPGRIRHRGRGRTLDDVAHRKCRERGARGRVVEEGGEAGPGPFFATSYPASAALLWGTEWGPGRGLVAGGILGVALVFARPLNGIALDEIDAGQVAAIVNGTVYYLAAGGGAGVVSRQLKRSAAQLRQATRETLRARERAARLAEREALGRAIHDSVLQALALVSKQAWELSDQPTVRGEDVRHLAATAAQQEAALRALVLREPEEGP